MLSGEARRAASILHQTSGWRCRRELWLTERTQQCQSGPTTTKAWFHDRCNRVDRDACVAPSGHLRKALPELHGKGGVRLAPPGRVRVAPPEPHRSWNKSERDPRGCGQRWRELGRQQSCIARRHAGSTARKRASSTIWTSVECNAEAGPSYRSCTASPQRRRSVTVPSLIIETICEL